MKGGEPGDEASSIHYNYLQKCFPKCMYNYNHSLNACTAHMRSLITYANQLLQKMLRPVKHFKYQRPSQSQSQSVSPTQQHYTSRQQPIVHPVTQYSLSSKTLFSVLHESATLFSYHPSSTKGKILCDIYHACAVNSPASHIIILYVHVYLH